VGEQTDLLTSSSMSEIHIGMEKSDDPPQIEFQDIPHSSSSGYPADTKEDADTLLAPPTVPVNNPGGADPNASFVSIDYYRKFFDVGTTTVLNRVWRALLPVPGQVFYQEDDRPDLYGTFWIATTVVLLLAASGNLAAYFKFLPTDKRPEWRYDFELMTLAATLYYVSISIVPLIIWFGLKHFGVAKSLVEVLSIYGYSFAVYVPITFVCIVPLNAVRWVGIVWSFLVSTWFVLRNIFPIEPELRKKTFILMIVAILYHAGLAFLTKIFFY